MVKITPRAFEEVQKRYRDALKKLGFWRRMVVGEKLSNRDLAPAFKLAAPIQDPLIPYVHTEILKGFEEPNYLDEQIVNGGLFFLHLWYGALEEQCRMESTKVPLLKKEKVEELLPQYKVPKGHERLVVIKRQDTDPVVRILWPIYKPFRDRYDERAGEMYDMCFIYPIFVVIQLLDQCNP